MPGAQDAARPGRILLIACGALAREVVDLMRLNAWPHMDVTCLPAGWHNTPQFIAEGVREKIHRARGAYDKIYVLYGDCGTGGDLDRVIEEEKVERIEGPHCYAFYTGVDRFIEEADADPTCFYLTDYLARHFDRLILKGLGIDRHPELLPMYFGNYTALVYLAQTDDPDLRAKAAAAAERLGLEYRYRLAGYGELEHFMAKAAKGAKGE